MLYWTLLFGVHLKKMLKSGCAGSERHRQAEKANVLETKDSDKLAARIKNC